MNSDQSKVYESALDILRDITKINFSQGRMIQIQEKARKVLSESENHPSGSETEEKGSGFDKEMTLNPSKKGTKVKSEDKSSQDNWKSNPEVI